MKTDMVLGAFQSFHLTFKRPYELGVIVPPFQGRRLLETLVTCTGSTQQSGELTPPHALSTPREGDS